MDVTVWILPGLAAFVLLISLLAKKLEYFLNFATRLCVGGLALYITSEIMMRLSYEGQIGLNTVTLTTVGLLGIPGYVLLLAVDIFGNV